MFASSVWPDSISCWLQIAAQAVLFMCMNTAGIFISYLSDRAQRQAFLETRRCVEARLRLETENQRQVLEKLSYLCMKCHWYLGKAGALSPPWLGGGATWLGGVKGVSCCHWFMVTGFMLVPVRLVGHPKAFHRAAGWIERTAGRCLFLHKKGPAIESATGRCWKMVLYTSGVKSWGTWCFSVADA